MSLIYRIPTGRPLTKEEHDANLAFLETSLQDLQNASGVLADQVSILPVSGLTYYVQATRYLIDGAYYSATPGNITLADADATFDRIDAVYVDIYGNIGKKTGVAGTSLTYPDIDLTTEYLVRFILVKAGAITGSDVDTGVDIGYNFIWKDGDEGTWTFSESSANIEISTTDPVNGTASILMTNALLNDKLLFTSSAKKQIYNYSYLVLTYEKTGLLPKQLYFRFYNGTNSVAYLAVSNGQFGFLRANTLGYVAIPLTAFGFTNVEFDKIEIYGSGTGNYKLDDIALLAGGVVAGRPTSEQVQADFLQEDETAPDFIKNKEYLALNPAGFNNNLAPTDDTLQKIADKFDAFAGGGAGENISPYVFSTTGYGAISDADISLGSTNFGTDNTTILQNLLDEALTKPITIVWDGKYSISNTLNIYGNTTIIGALGAGVILRNSSNCQVFLNANIVQPSPIGGEGSNIIDENIHIENLIINGNGYNTGIDGDTVFDVENGGSAVNGSAQKRKHMMQWIGVRNLTFKDCEFLGARLYACQVKNVEFFSFENIKIDFGLVSKRDNFNYDGIHINGYARFGKLDNINIKNNHDDAIALNANDAVVDTGSILDISLNNIYFNDATYPIRFLSTDERLDRIYINNIKGNTAGCLIKFDTAGLPGGFGNIGTITFENIDAIVEEDTGYPTSNTDNTYILIKDTVINKLIIKNISRQNFNENYPYIEVKGSNSSIKELLIDGVLMESVGGVFAKPFLTITGGEIEKCIINNIQHNERTSTINAPIVDVSGGTITDLILNNVITNNISKLVDNSSGILTSISANNIIQKNGSNAFSTDGTVIDVNLGNYNGLIGNSILNGVFTNKRGSSLDYLGVYTTSTFPSPINFAGSSICVSDAPNGYVFAFSNGVNWIDVTDGSVIASTSVSILLEENFTGTTVDTLKGIITNPNSADLLISQNNKLLFTRVTDNSVSGVVENKWESVNTYSKGGAVSFLMNKDVGFTDAVYTARWVFNGVNDFIAIQRGATINDIRLIIFQAGAFAYDFNLTLSSNNRFKITYNSLNDIKFWYWNGVWIQIGTTQNFNIGVAGSVLFGSTSNNVDDINDVLSFDQLRVTDVDYTTELP